jgi:hypothetical protein
VTLVGLTICVPFVACVPVHPPLAMHAVALVLDHVNVELPPGWIGLGLALMVMVGAEPVVVPDTVTELDPVALL